MVGDSYNQGSDQEQEQDPSNNDEEEPLVNEPEEDLIGDNNTNFIGSLFRLVIALAVVLGLIFLISKFLKKRKGFMQQGQVLENYGGISLGPNKSVQTIKIGQRYFAVGVSDTIEVLMEITDKETIEQLEQKPAEFGSWDTIKTKLVKPNKQAGKSEEQSKPFTAVFNKELVKMKDDRSQAFARWKGRKQDHDHPSD